MTELLEMDVEIHCNPVKDAANQRFIQFWLLFTEQCFVSLDTSGLSRWVLVRESSIRLIEEDIRNILL